VSDDGDLTWECGYYDDSDAGEIADAVVGIVTDGIGDRAGKRRRARPCGRRAAARRDR
jgi:hypothetical protein